ncbi:MAG: mechanosensitive ion channel [Armatimonadetes bacterium]|nr:mechanosensitive ion channel [Armatimonadota bacterium]
MLEDLARQPVMTIHGEAVTALQVGMFLGMIGAVTALAWLLGLVFRRMLSRLPLEDREVNALARLVFYLVLAYGWLAAFQGIHLDPSHPFLTLGGTQLSMFSLATFVALVFLVVLGSAIVGRVVASEFLKKSALDEGARFAIGRITYYVLLVAGLMAAIQTIGIQLASLTVILGALSVGIGFGLQNIVNNFVSGLILLFERPIKVGDWIEVEQSRGRVADIGARSTTVVTRDNVAIIIPNGDCLSNPLINWSHHGDPTIRVRVPVGVAYGSDLEQVRKALLEVAASHPEVLAKPAPVVQFDRFGDSALELHLVVWVDVRRIGVRKLRSDLNFAIEATFRRHDVQIPSPQLDVRIQGAPTEDTEQLPSVLVAR